MRRSEMKDWEASNSNHQTTLYSLKHAYIIKWARFRGYSNRYNRKRGVGKEIIHDINLEKLETCRWNYNVCRPVRALEWARLASHVTPTIYPKLISFIISFAFLVYFAKGMGCREIALAICFKICFSDPPWLVILLKRLIADGKKSE